MHVRVLQTTLPQWLPALAQVLRVLAALFITGITLVALEACLAIDPSVGAPEFVCQVVAGVLGNLLAHGVSKGLQTLGPV